MNSKFLGVMVSMVALVACGDSGSSSNGGSGGSGGGPEGGSPTTGGSGGTTTQGGGGSGGAPVELTCETGCDVLYDCGVEDMNCPGFSGDPMEKDAFVAGCIETCTEQMALLNLIQPNDCGATVDTISMVAADTFGDVCQNGFAMGGGGAGGGM
jgi:hypothetical protein